MTREGADVRVVSLCLRCSEGQFLLLAVIYQLGGPEYVWAFRNEGHGKALGSEG